MQAVIDEFEERVREVDLYMSLLRSLGEPDVEIRFATGHRRRRNIDQAVLRVLKASTFLLLYNLVESAIRGGMGAVYEAIRLDQCTPHDVKENFIRLWVDQQFDKLDRNTVSLRNYQEKAHELIRQVLGSVVLELDRESLPISGNLDANQIRAVCKKHGVSFKAHKAASGGSKIDLVRRNRNALAHGDMSFSECGRQYSIGDLEEIKKQAVIFTRSILRNIKGFVAKKSYAT